MSQGGGREKGWKDVFLTDFDRMEKGEVGNVWKGKDVERKRKKKLEEKEKKEKLEEKEDLDLKMARDAIINIQKAKRYVNGQQVSPHLVPSFLSLHPTSFSSFFSPPSYEEEKR